MTELIKQELDQVINAFGTMINDINEGDFEFSNKDITKLMLELSKTLIKIDVSIEKLDKRVTELENKK